MKAGCKTPLALFLIVSFVCVLEVLPNIGLYLMFVEM